MLKTNKQRISIILSNQPSVNSRLQFFCILLLFLYSSQGLAQLLLKPDHVFDGDSLHQGWVVFIDGEQIIYAGPDSNVEIPEGTEILDLAGKTLLPGIIEGHSHLLLHPYNETSWNDQVLKESSEERAIRGAIHAEKSLLAGITSMRDLGSEGAGYA
ncbi:MAG: hypothetical protein HKO11_00095, partial [Eudoraea sp.]|nr:hypothetical protein [Eudoraea sp.]